MSESLFICEDPRLLKTKTIFVQEYNLFAKIKDCFYLPKW